MDLTALVFLCFCLVVCLWQDPVDASMASTRVRTAEAGSTLVDQIGLEGGSIDQVEVSDDARYTVTDFSAGNSMHSVRESHRFDRRMRVHACVRPQIRWWLEGRWNNRIR